MNYINRFLPWLLLCVLLVPGCQKDLTLEPRFESFEEELDYLVEQYVRMGAAIGIIDQQQKLQEYYFGSLSNENSNPPDSHSLFEIGSITKTLRQLCWHK